MQILTLQVINDKAFKVLQQLQENHYINIIASANLDSPVFPGMPLKRKQFKELILNRENGKTVSLKEIKAKWERKRNKLLKLSE